MRPVVEKYFARRPKINASPICGIVGGFRTTAEEENVAASRCWIGFLLRSGRNWRTFRGRDKIFARKSSGCDYANIEDYWVNQ